MNRRIALAVAATALGGGLAFAPAAQADSGSASGGMSAAGTCNVWFDDHTYGASCAGGPYKAVAYCNTGWPWLTAVYGSSQTNWGWSYAYCSSVQGTLDHGAVQFF